jgi:hypothetical protein
MKFIGKISWTSFVEITPIEKLKIKRLLETNYYIIVTRRTNHLSTYFIGLSEVFLRFKFGYWAHAVMNLEDTVTVETDFRIMEATGKGVHYTEFDKVFDVQSVALLIPRSMTVEDWTSILDKAKEQLGKPYDTLFNIADDSKISCIELVRTILKDLPDYDVKFKNFEAMIAKSKNVTPQMLYDCKDFEVVFEIRK